MTCCICEEPFDDTVVDAAKFTPSCHHGVHAMCLALWLTRGPIHPLSCPVCRTPDISDEDVEGWLTRTGVDVDALYADTSYPRSPTGGRQPPPPPVN
eukprot:2824143-Pyramimonas_sp.AAC.1